MTAAEQFRKFGACVEADDGLIILQTDRTFMAMTLEEIRQFDHVLHQAAHQAARQRASREQREAVAA